MDRAADHEPHLAGSAAQGAHGGQVRRAGEGGAPRHHRDPPERPLVPGGGPRRDGDRVRHEEQLVRSVHRPSSAECRLHRYPRTASSSRAVARGAAPCLGSVAGPVAASRRASSAVVWAAAAGLAAITHAIAADHARPAVGGARAAALGVGVRRMTAASRARIGTPPARCSHPGGGYAQGSAPTSNCGLPTQLRVAIVPGASRTRAPRRSQPGGGCGLFVDQRTARPRRAWERASPGEARRAPSQPPRSGGVVVVRRRSPRPGT
jgi:hypothetical protein